MWHAIYTQKNEWKEKIGKWKSGKDKKNENRPWPWELHIFCVLSKVTTYFLVFLWSREKSLRSIKILILYFDFIHPILKEISTSNSSTNCRPWVAEWCSWSLLQSWWPLHLDRRASFRLWTAYLKNTMLVLYIFFFQIYDLFV